MIKNKLFLLPILIVGLMIGCTNKSHVSKINIQVSSPFSISYDDFGEDDEMELKRSVNDYLEQLDIAIFNKTNNAEVFHQHQLSSDNTFGSLSTQLTDGRYTLVIVGTVVSDSLMIRSINLASFNDATMNKEVFYFSQDITVSNSTTQNITATLQRACAKFMVQTLDPLPTSVSTIKYQFSNGSYSLNPVTGLAASNNGYIRFLTPQANNYGHTVHPMCLILLNTDEQAMDITIQALDSNQTVLYNHEFNNISLKRNRVTIATGNLFSSDGNFNIMVNDLYSDTTFVNF